MKELLEEIRRSGRLIAEGFTLIHKHLYLLWIDWHLDLYLASCKKNKRLFMRIDTMIHRYNARFGENLSGGISPQKEA